MTGSGASMRLLVVLLSMLSIAGGCAGNDPQGSAGAGGAAGAGSTGSVLPSDKGEPCMQDSDCNGLNAKCREGNICTGPLGGHAFEEECTLITEGECAGVSCIEFPPTASKTGICSLPCDIDEDCGPGAVCIDIGGGNLSCLAVCSVDSDCANGFVCTTVNGQTGTNCWLVP
jgi:hypothetical protein